MRAKSTWMLLFFLLSSLVVAAMFNFAFRDLFAWMQIDNKAILGDNLRLATLLALALATVSGIFFGVFYHKSRRYIEQCVIEFDKVAWPEWKETKTATFTVVGVSIVASLILGVFDTVFSWLTSNNLFIW